VLALHLGSLGVRPGGIGTVFGAGALVSTVMHPLFGRLTDRLGARRMTLVGLVAVAVNVVALSQSWSFASAIVLFCVAAAGAALVITPSLAFMSEAIAGAGIGSFGIAYGIYNMAWGAGLLAGPSAGGFLYERLGFSSLALGWSPVLLLVTALLARVKSVPSPVTVT